MSSPNAGKSRWMIPARILVLLIVAGAAIRSGILPRFFDPYGLVFVLVGGAALILINFSGADVGSAFRHAAGTPGNEAEIRNAAFFWEAAGRSFWILGVLHSVYSFKIAFGAMAFMEITQIAVINYIARFLVSTVYGILLSVVCFIPYWKLAGKLSGRRALISEERSGTVPAGGLPGGGSLFRFRIIIGYVLFLALLVPTLFQFPVPSIRDLLPFAFHNPSLLAVLGGAIAIVLFIGKSESGPTLSAAFAFTGLLGALAGCVQALFGLGETGVSGIAGLALGIAFILNSCFAALMGIAVAGAPMDDHAIRTGRIAAPSAASRVSWYVFPLLALMFLILAFVMVTMPLPRQ